jgi:hypothetical protein
MFPRAPTRPAPLPLETNDVPIVVVGTSLWAAALVVLTVLLVADVTEVPGWWLAMCGCGIVLGLFGIRGCRRRQATLDQTRPGQTRRSPVG